MSNSDVLLAELKSVLAELYDQNDSKNKELIGLIRTLVKRMENAEHELFNTDGSINELRDRIKALEYHAKRVNEDRNQLEKSRDNRKNFWRGVLSKAGGGILLAGSIALLAKFGIKV